MYSPFDFERIPTVDAANLISGDRILFCSVKRRCPAVKLMTDCVLVENISPLAGDAFQNQPSAAPAGHPHTTWIQRAMSLKISSLFANQSHWVPQFQAACVKAGLDRADTTVKSWLISQPPQSFPLECGWLCLP